MTSRLAQGEIATAPAAGRVDIVLNGFDADQRFNDCRYTPRGVTAPVFQQGALDLDRLAGEITQSDSRLSVGAEEVIDLAAATIRTVRVAIDQA
jgi:hypothetical protein